MNLFTTIMVLLSKASAYAGTFLGLFCIFIGVCNRVLPKKNQYFKLVVEGLKKRRILGIYSFWLLTIHLGLTVLLHSTGNSLVNFCYQYGSGISVYLCYAVAFVFSFKWKGVQPKAMLEYRQKAMYASLPLLAIHLQVVGTRQGYPIMIIFALEAFPYLTTYAVLHSWEVKKNK